MAKRVLTSEQRHRISLALQRVIQQSAELREAQVDLIYAIADSQSDSSTFWIKTLAIFGDGSVESEADSNQFILRCLRYAELKPRDVYPRCDVRPCTKQQQKAIERLGGKPGDYSYAQAEDEIRNAQTRKARNDKRTGDRKADKGRRTTVSTKR